MIIQWNGNSLEKNVRKTIVKIVVKTKNKFVLKPRLEEAKTLGIKINIINGLTTPPVKYINIAVELYQLTKILS